MGFGKCGIKKWFIEFDDSFLAPTFNTPQKLWFSTGFAHI
jgi:hypothetical protein